MSVNEQRFHFICEECGTEFTAENFGDARSSHRCSREIERVDMSELSDIIENLKSESYNTYEDATNFARVIISIAENAKCNPDWKTDIELQVMRYTLWVKNISEE